MRLTKRKILHPIIILFLGFLIYLVIFGRLFIISPFKIGFQKHKTEYATVYYHKNDKQINYDTLDSLIFEVEQFHNLNFNKEVKLFFCESNNEYKRYTGSSSLALATIFNKGIFVSGNINKKRKIKNVHLNIYLKHELSHLLLYQNMSIIKAFYYPHWFLEGLAVYSSNQLGIDGYSTKEKIFNLIKKGNFINPKDWGTLLISKGKSVKECKVDKKNKFAYSVLVLLTI